MRLSAFLTNLSVLVLSQYYLLIYSNGPAGDNPCPVASPASALCKNASFSSRVVNFPEIKYFLKFSGNFRKYRQKPGSYNIYNFRSNSLIFLGAVLKISYFF